MSKKLFWSLIILIFVIFFWLYTRGYIHVQQGVDEKVATSEVWTNISGTLFISPYGVEEEVLDILTETKYSIDMWMYQLTSKEVMTMLKNLGQLGVDIDIVLENQPYGAGSKDFDKVVATLSPVWAEIVSDDAMGTNFVHAKTLILDEERFIISTANLGYSSFRRNREYWFVGSHTE